MFGAIEKFSRKKSQGKKSMLSTMSSTLLSTWLERTVEQRPVWPHLDDVKKNPGVGTAPAGGKKGSRQLGSLAFSARLLDHDAG